MNGTLPIFAGSSIALRATLGALNDGQLYGPFVPPGAPGIELFIGKASRSLRPGSDA